MLAKRAKLKNLVHLFGILTIVFTLLGCVTPTATPEGLQKEFAALNPARIAAFPPVLVPHPVSKLSIDPATLLTANISETVERKILSAFKNQPGVNGISFNSVRAALKDKPKLTESIGSEIKSAAQRVNDSMTRNFLLLSKACQQQKNLLDFYNFCVTGSPSWQSLLNQFSAAVYNTDTVLLPLVTAVEKKLDNGAYVLTFGVSVLLIDTNTGKLMWGRDSIERIAMPPEKKHFAEVKTIVDKAFSENFWNDFPGRRTASGQMNKE